MLALRLMCNEPLFLLQKNKKMKKQQSFSGMSPEDAAFLLLAQICRTNTETLLEAFNSFDYTPRRKKKRSGGYRQYFVPHDNLKNIQQRLLRHFFCQLDRREIYVRSEYSYWTEKQKYFSKLLHGFLLNRSYVDNARRHTKHFTRFVARLDLKDAFPSITRAMIEEPLRDIIQQEIKMYWQSSTAHDNDRKAQGIINRVMTEMGPFPRMPSPCASLRRKDFVYWKVEKWRMKLYDLFDLYDPENITWKFRDGIASGTRNGMVPWSRIYQQYPLFPARRCKAFRELVRSCSGEQKLDGFTQQIIDSFVALVLELVTYQNRLVQGAPTSGFLFMLFMQHKKILSGVQRMLYNKYHLHTTLSMYADDITIGFEKRPTIETLTPLIEFIESHGLRINPKKTKIWDRRQIAPVITGVRLIRKQHQGNSIDKFIEARKMRDVNFSGAMQRKREGGIWYEDALGIPKKLQRKMRAIFHQGATMPDVPETLHDLIAGYKGMIVQVYGGFLSDVPQGIAKPLRRYLKRFGKFKTLSNS